jgi:2-dehydropantoate 2-reductase
VDLTVVGAGALGTFLAAKLKVRRVVCRPERKGQLRKHGLKFTGAENGAARPDVVDVDELGKLEGPVLLAVKATGLAEALQALRPHLTERAPVVLCQAGIGVLEAASRIMPADRLVRAGCWLEVEGVSPGVARLAALIRIELAGSVAKAVQAALKPIPTRDVEDVGICEWRRALLGISVHAACALADTPNGAAASNAALRRACEQLLAEAAEVARGEGNALGEAEFAEVFEAAKATGDAINPILRDLRAKRPTEVGWLNSAVVKLGLKHKVATPANTLVAELIAARSS